jgi:hypothetical protein
MTTTNHTSPSGEDAANGAIGEREALLTNAQLSDLYSFAKGEPRQEWIDHAREFIARAALTAEKVAAEPVAWMIRIGDSNVCSYTQLESDADFYGKQSGMKYEKRPLYAAPQPAQTQVALSRAEIARIAGSCMESGRYAMFMAYIDAALAKETNNG